MNHPRHRIYPQSLCVFLSLGLLTAVIGCNPTTGGGDGAPSDGDGAVDLSLDGNQDGYQTDVELGAAEVLFPDSGDALIVVLEDEGLGSAVYFGVDDGVSVRPTRLVADAGEDQLSIVFDAEGRPAQVTLGSFGVDFTFNPDGTFNATTSDGDEVLFTDTNIELSNAKVASPLQQGVGEIQLIACETIMLLSLAEERFGALDDDLLSCLMVRTKFTSIWARIRCVVSNTLERRFGEVQRGCPVQPDPDACFRRVAPFLAGVVSILDLSKVALIKAIDKVNLSFPPCVFDPTQPPFSLDDSDMDGVRDFADLCRNTPLDDIDMVNVFGCTPSELGAIDCREAVEAEKECLRDGCCQEGCLDPFDPDCTNLELCEFGGEFCCVDDDKCDLACPQVDPECSDPDFLCAAQATDQCSLDGCCQVGCIEPFDPDCSNERLCEFWEVLCCPDDGICTEGCPAPDPNCDELVPDGGSMDTGVSDGEECEIGGCGDGEFCCSDQCQPLVVPTEALCPRSFQLADATAPDDVFTATLDSFEVNESRFEASCVYVRQAGQTRLGSIWFDYRPVSDLGGLRDGFCGQAEDEIRILGSFGAGSTTHTIKVTVNAELRFFFLHTIDVVTGVLNNALAAGVGADCSCQ